MPQSKLEVELGVVVVRIQRDRLLQVRDGDEIMIMAAQGKILRCKVDDIREIGRNTQGVRILDLEEADDRVVGVARLAETAERDAVPPGNGDGGPPADNGE